MITKKGFLEATFKGKHRKILYIKSVWFSASSFLLIILKSYEIQSTPQNIARV